MRACAQHEEPVPVAAADDVELPVAGVGDHGVHLAALVTGVADDALDKGEAPSRLSEQSLRAITILDARGMDVDGQQ